MKRDHGSPAEGAESFHATHWTIVMRAVQSQAQGGQSALAELCRLYWYPLYVFTRLHGHSPDDAQDLIQGFFLHLLEHRALTGVDRLKGKFRSFLLASLQNFLADALDRARCLKREGNEEFVHLDTEDAEERYRLEPIEFSTAERIFDARWAMTVLGEAMNQLRQEYATEGKASTFETLKVFLDPINNLTPHSYEEVAHQLQVSMGGVKTLIDRLRKRYTALLREEVGRTVCDPAELDEEIHALCEALVASEGWLWSMKMEDRRSCSVCGTECSASMEFCPVCLLRRGLDEPPESDESSSLEKASVESCSGLPEHRFEHYELVKGEDGKPVELGRGAMGVTYKAFDVNLRCPVTLKVISERYLGDEAARLRFLREARAAAKVRHQNVATVFHLGRTGENYFYAMEFVEGETLENLIKRSGHLEVKLALEITTQVAAGLAAVHEQSLVHRDIKPTNIMVKVMDGACRTAKIIDLGLAKATMDESASQAAISAPGGFAGTPEFASPEQFAGVGVDIRSDLYSLGVSLWEMVTGQAPFQGSPAEVMYQHQHASLPLDRLIRVSQPVVILLEMLLEKDPGRRFQNPAELLKGLPTITGAIDAGRRITRQSLQKMPPGASPVVIRKPPARLGQFVSFILGRAKVSPSDTQGGSPVRESRSPGSVPKKISVARLPVTGSDVFGREEDIAFLDAAWANQDVNVVSIIAWAGVGKSTLVNHWLRRMATDHYRSAELVFGWSFYRQGTGRDTSSADEFLDVALSWFGDPDPRLGTAWEKGERLAKLVAQRRTLLVLDGLGPLQNPPGPQEGRLREPSLQALLRELAAFNTGLCIITTRLPVADIADHEGTSVLCRELEQLSSNAGAKLLRALGVKGGEAELRNASDEFSGHCLALTLLSSYLTDAFDGDVRRRDGVSTRLAHDVRQGVHARQVMESYQTWFGEGPELSILRMLGLFDRPTDEQTFRALLKSPAIPGLTEPLTDLGPTEWQTFLAKLRRAKLLAQEDPQHAGQLDTHPLVREYFGEQLQSQRTEAWKECNRRLYHYYQTLAPRLPETFRGMEPLFLAVVCGCNAGLFREALREVYIPRIQRGDSCFAANVLGARSALLSILTHFFEPGRLGSLVETDVQGQSLTAEDQLFVLMQAAQYLTATRGLAAPEIRICYERAESLRDAINAGRAMMKTIRVSVSSTGDVQKERILADRVIRSVAAEFNVPVSASKLNFQRLAEENGVPENDASKSEPENHGRCVLCPHFLEYGKFQLDAEYHGAIPIAAEFDLVICLLWARLGPLLAPTLKMPDGSQPRSGTEYEISWALDGAGKNRGLPQLRVYRNSSNPTPPLEPKEEREAFGRQWDSCQEFFAHWEKNSEGSFARAFHNYRNLQEFEELFREHFRDFLAGRVEQGMGQEVLSKEVRRWKSSPFRGLNVFDFEHAPIFHGRTRAIGEVLEALEGQVRAQRPFVLVVGASGSGKSSLVRAGVLPLLTQAETIEGIGLWRWTVTRPGAGGSSGDCFDALAAALLEPSALPVLADPESQNAIRDLASELREHYDSVALRVRDALDHAAREWKTRHSHFLEQRERHLRGSGRSEDADLARQQKERLELPKARLALMVDQLEELFTTGFSPEVRQKYISALAGLVRSGRVFVLATIRSDFYASYQEFPDLIELTKPNGKVDLRPPTPDEIRNMIRLPAEAAGLHFEQDRETGQHLDDALRDTASATPESLPLLEHVLSLLYDQQSSRGDDLLRWSDYRELGELKGALAKHAEAVFSTLGPDDQRAFPLVMRHLVTLGQGEEEVPNRRTVPYRDFVGSGETDRDQKAGAKGFVDLFIQKRLLVADTDPQGGVTVSVAHEALLREWQRVKEWLKENREFLRMRDRLDSSLKLWLSRGKQKDDLLEPGLHLAEGEKLVKDFGQSLSRAQTDYVYASVAERNRRRQTQTRIRYAVMAAISVLAILAGVQWLQAERHRQSAEKNAALAQAEEARTKQALASEAEVAAKLRDQLRQASWTSFNQAERQFGLGEWREGIALLARAIKFDPTNQVASERFFQELIVHREKSLPSLIVSFPHQDVLERATFSPDGARILTASWDKTAKLWGAASGKLVFSFAHQGVVWRVAFSPDGARVLTASADKTAKLWDAASGELIASFAHQDSVNDAVFSPDGARILTASADRSAKLWDVASDGLIASFAHQDSVNDAVFSPDGARVLTASADKTAKLWDAASGGLIASFAHQGEVNDVAFSPDGARILTASRDNTAKLWDVASGKLIASFDHQDEVFHAAFSPDGARILTASRDNTAKLWDVASSKVITSFAHDLLNGAAFSPDGERILTASENNGTKLWEAASGKLIASFVHQDTVHDAAFSPSSAGILTASFDKTAKLWDATSGELIASCAHQDGLYHAAFSPDGARILTASADKTAKLWDAASGELIASFAHQGEVNDVAFSPDGARILTASADHSAKLWDVASGKLIASFDHQASVYSGAFSPDGARILTASADKTAKLWDVASSKLITSFAHEDAVQHAAFSPEGARILTASADKTAKLWDVASGKLITSFAHDSQVNGAAFSPDGARILTASEDHSAKLWDAASGKLIASFAHQDNVRWGAFSPDGSQIVTASADKTAKLWDGASGKLNASFNHQASVYYATFSPDGARILTTSADNTAKLWDAASGKPIASFAHQDTVRWGAFNPDGARILTASWDKTAKLWDAATPVELAREVKESGDSTAKTGSSVSISASSALQVESLSEIASGLQFSDDGSLVAVNEERRSKLTQQLKDLARDLRPNACFIRWFFSTGGDRTIFPASNVKIGEWVDIALLTNPNVTEEWLRNALISLPYHPLLHIALARFETDSKRADFLRLFGLARLPRNSVVCTRAGEMLLAQHRPELALAAADKAFLADPANVPAQRLRLKILDAMTR